jgi:hypothetical protein
MALAGLRSRARGLEIPLHIEQQFLRPMWRDLVCSASCSFSVLWCGEAFCELGVQSADVAALPGALPQPSVSPASQQSLWITKLMQSATVSQSPSWISPWCTRYLACSICVFLTFFHDLLLFSLVPLLCLPFLILFFQLAPLCLSSF